MNNEINKDTQKKRGRPKKTESGRIDTKENATPEKKDTSKPKFKRKPTKVSRKRKEYNDKYSVVKVITPRVEAFIDFYIETGRQSEAAAKAGYSPKTAGQMGWRLGNDPKVKELIEIRKAEIAKTRALTISDIITQYENIAFADISFVYEDWSKLRDFKTLPQKAKNVIKNIRLREVVKSDGEVERTVFIEMHDKLTALKELEKFYTQEKPTQQILNIINNSNIQIEGEL